ncbi:MAG: VanW family protein, partial [uncultured bacterium]
MSHSSTSKPPSKKAPQKGEVLEKRTRKFYGVYLGMGLVVLMVVLMGGFQIALADKVAPNTIIGEQNLSGEEGVLARKKYEAALEAFDHSSLTIHFKDVPYTFTLEELGVTLHKEQSLQAFPVMTFSNWARWVPLFLPGSEGFRTQYSLDEAKFQEAIAKRIVDLNMEVQNAKLAWNSTRKDLDVLPEQRGWTAEMEALKQAVEAQVAHLDPQPLELNVTIQEPTVTTAQLEPQKEELKIKLAQTTTLLAQDQAWEIPWMEHLDWITFEPVTGTNAPQVNLGLNSELAQQNWAETIGIKVEKAPEDVTILKDDQGRITFEGTATNGIQIRYETLMALVETALNQSIPKVEIPLKETLAKVTAPQELQDLGIQELYSTGYTAFYHSTANRIKNISVAINRFNGVLIAPGEQFSFGKQLGPVDGSTGYVKELVIKEDRTIPEYGGGVCQVSSTIYRAALYGGLPIIKRNNHSYAVSYYAYPNGYGLDATVYPPQVDLVFENDTGHHLLVQSFINDQSEAYFKFYGTRDGREVAMEGPFITNRRGA